MLIVNKTSAATLEFLHQVPPHGPHARSLAEYVHRDRGEEASQLDASNRYERILCAIAV